MDFEKKYPLTQFKGEFVLVRWTRGYKDVALYYRDQLILEHKGAAKLMKGITYETSQLGPIRLSLAEKPVMLDLVVNGLHSPVNVSHPMKELRALSFYFWILLTFAIIAGGIEAGMFRESGIGDIVFTVDLFVLVVYLTAALLVRKGYAIGYFLGFTVFTIMHFITLYALLTGFVWGYLLYIFAAIRLVGQVLLSINLKTAIQVMKHKKYNDNIAPDLLDVNL